MKKIIKGILAAVFAAAAISIPAFAAESNNLLINPGAENSLSGWVDTDGTWTASTPIAPNNGESLFFAGAIENSKLYQDVDISQYVGGKIKLSGYLAGWSGQEDEAVLTLMFLDKSKSALGEYSVSRENGTDWAYYELTENIPSGASYARVILNAIRHSGSDNDGYFDDLSLIAEGGTSTATQPASKPTNTSSDNLLINPSAEDGLNAWVDTDGTWTAGTPTTPYDGESLFFAGAIENSSLYQDVNISQYAGKALKLGGYLAGWSNQEDEAVLTLKFLDSSGRSLGESSVSRGADTDWAYYELTENIPSGASKARVVLNAIRHSGSDNDGYFDALSLSVVKAVPEKQPTKTITETTTQATTRQTTTAQTTTKSAPQTAPSDKKTQTKPFSQTSSPWAQKEMEEAYNNGLIPEVLIDKDLKTRITRAEFASVAVTLYEELSGNNLPEGSTPFTDISGAENTADIQKAYNSGIAVGTSQTKFEPDTQLNREQLVTMLCRAIKKYKFPEWTIASDSDYAMVASAAYKKFADDADISNFAKDSVYFMSNLGIVKGIDDTHFAPKNLTDEQTASGYAIATREQAIAISLRIFKRSDLM